MDTKNEDTMVRQIEKNLSNNLNDSLFLTGKAYDSSRPPAKNSTVINWSENTNTLKATSGGKGTDTSKSNGIMRNNKPTKISENENSEREANQEYPLVSNDYISNIPGISRAEYIRQARESCLRQLSSIQIYSKPYDVNYMDSETASDEQLNQKKAKAMKLFQNNEEEENSKPKENTILEFASYRSLIIRSACAIVLFLGIFAFDKFNFKVGDFSNSTIQEYVMDNDALQELEDMIVTWLK